MRQKKSLRCAKQLVALTNQSPKLICLIDKPQPTPENSEAGTAMFCRLPNSSRLLFEDKRIGIKKKKKKKKKKKRRR